MALDTGAVPDVDSTAGMGGDTGETGGGGSQEPTMDEMDAIMASEAAVDDAAGFELGDKFTIGQPTAKPPEVVKKPDDKPAAEPVAAKPDVEAKPDEPNKEEPPAPDPAATRAVEEAARLRRGFQKLAKDREQVAARINEANAALERAKAFEASHAALQSLPEKVKADPLAFLAEHGVDVNTLLDKVIETEKSPVERKIEQLERQILAEKEAAKKAAAEREQREAEQRNAQIIAEWHAQNISVAKSDPEKYDLILSLGQEEAVHETCLAYHRLHGQILDPRIAADEVEKTLRAGVKKSKFITTVGQSTPAAPGKPPTAAPAAQGARPSNGTPAPKQTGPRTLASVSSGDSTPSATEYPEDDDARFEVALREMRAEGLIA